ncbi:hypothetical protein [Agromyces sp. PvR057]|uniref:hypothetical protein n=1 Tax=Agromyces sp. PvR057 TaxID=3156403 RepID=UPI003392A189
MTRLIEAISWNGLDVELILFGIWPARRPEANPHLAAQPVPNSLRTYAMEDLDDHLPSRDCFEYDLVFEAVPDDLESTVTAWLQAAIAAGAEIAWFAFEGSFHFEHVLTPDVASHVYAIADSTGVHLGLDDDMRNSTNWVLELTATRERTAF